jgi:hypothetical protein
MHITSAVTSSPTFKELPAELFDPHLLTAEFGIGVSGTTRRREVTGERDDELFQLVDSGLEFRN